jgi:predicted branched-subunit amino acid permease
MQRDSDIGDGVRAALPIVLPSVALGMSFGILARPVMGSIAPIAMSILVFSGGAQFAALSVLQGGGSAVAAITAGMLMKPAGFR